MRSARILLGFACLTLLGGCSSNQDEAYRRAFAELARARRKMVQILESVKDKQSMAEALERLEKAQGQFRRAEEGLQRLGKPSREVLQRFQEESDEVQNATVGVLEEMRRIAKLPGGDDFLQAVKRISRPDERP
jgi:hypothetical protein